MKNKIKIFIKNNKKVIRDHINNTNNVTGLLFSKLNLFKECYN